MYKWWLFDNETFKLAAFLVNAWERKPCVSNMWIVTIVVDHMYQFIYFFFLLYLQFIYWGTSDLIIILLTFNNGSVTTAGDVTTVKYQMKKITIYDCLCYRSMQLWFFSLSTWLVNQ